MSSIDMRVASPQVKTNKVIWAVLSHVQVRTYVSTSKYILCLDCFTVMKIHIRVVMSCFPVDTASASIVMVSPSIAASCSTFDLAAALAAPAAM